MSTSPSLNTNTAWSTSLPPCKKKLYRQVFIPIQHLSQHQDTLSWRINPSTSGKPLHLTTKEKSEYAEGGWSNREICLKKCLFFRETSRKGPFWGKYLFSLRNYASVENDPKLGKQIFGLHLALGTIFLPMIDRRSFKCDVFRSLQHSLWECFSGHARISTQSDIQQT